MASSRRSPPSVWATRRAPDNKHTFRIPWNYSTSACGTLAPISQGAPLCEPLRRLQWLRQELDLWDEVEGARPMPQPRQYGLNLPDLKPSDVHWRASP